MRKLGVGDLAVEEEVWEMISNSLEAIPTEKTEVRSTPGPRAI